MTTVSTIKGRPQAHFPLQVPTSIGFILRSLRLQSIRAANYPSRDLDLPTQKPCTIGPSLYGDCLLPGTRHWLSVSQSDLERGRVYPSEDAEGPKPMRVAA